MNSKYVLVNFYRAVVAVAIVLFMVAIVAGDDDDYVLGVILRIIVILMASVSIVALIIGFIRYGKFWNEKTRDYWFGRISWCVAGTVASAEAIARHTSFRYATIFFVVAAAVTFKAVLQRGSWGTSDEAIKERNDKPNHYTG